MKSWIVPGAGAGRARVRLFCFAHAGGGAVLFRSWQQHLTPDVEVCPVVLPGRETRLREAAFNRMEQLLGPLCDALSPYADKPMAFFGHSMGAGVAYEVACELPARVGRDPLVLFVSGRRAPHLPLRRPASTPLDDEALMAMMKKLNGTPPEVLQDRDLMTLYLPCLRADFELNDSYVRRREARLVCPVAGFVGDSDPEVSPTELEEWRNVTTGAFSFRIFDGDHFYLKAARPDVLVCVRDELSAALASTR